MSGAIEMGSDVRVVVWYGGRGAEATLEDVVSGPETSAAIGEMLRSLLDQLEVLDTDTPVAWLYTVGRTTIFGGRCHGGPRDGSDLQSRSDVYLEPIPQRIPVQLDREPSLGMPKLPVHRYVWGKDGWSYEEANH